MPRKPLDLTGLRTLATTRAIACAADRRQQILLLTRQNASSNGQVHEIILLAPELDRAAGMAGPVVRPSANRRVIAACPDNQAIPRERGGTASE